MEDNYYLFWEQCSQTFLFRGPSGVQGGCHRGGGGGGGVTFLAIFACLKKTNNHTWTI